jgi:ornithine cyclodeaminase/alanine dehydrogenase-like protein (mu-crystallin family)
MKYAFMTCLDSSSNVAATLHRTAAAEIALDQALRNRLNHLAVIGAGFLA